MFAEDIKRRICQAKRVNSKRKNLFTLKNISLKTKKNLLESYDWDVALYERKWWWSRRMMKIRWKEKFKNEKVYLTLFE